MCLASQFKCKYFKMNDLHIKTASCGANPVKAVKVIQSVETKK
jgi:hypothetical protein